LALELPVAADPADAALDYPQIFANAANIDGNLEIRANHGVPVLWDDSYTFENVIEADVLNGTFDDVIVANAGPLISAQAIYDAADNVDINIERTPFDDGCLAFGGTFNQCSTAGGIENVYSIGLTGP